MKIITTFSGGKDSLASLIKIKNDFGTTGTTVFCDTAWESNITYHHINIIEKKMNLNLVRLRSKDYSGFSDLSKKKKGFPAVKKRFCTTELKTKPMIDFILEQEEDLLIIQGIRGDESKKRAAMDKQCTFFKYYFEPYQTNTMIVEHIGAMRKRTAIQQKKLNKAKARLVEGKEDPKYHTYRKKEVKEWCTKYTHDILRPVFDWSGKEVVDYIKDNGYENNPLYKQGFSRVGCFPCIMCNKHELLQIALRYPERIKEIAELEKEYNYTFFRNDYIPKKFCSKRTINKNGDVIYAPTINDAAEYVKNKNLTGDLFRQENTVTSCMSFYGLCE